jgi:hypothetical protein
MINQIAWAMMKTGIDNNPSIPYFYSTENSYCSNDQGIPNIDRYYIRQEIQSGVTNYCFIDKDGGYDHIEFDTNYKSIGIETV